ncbi:conserved hypothetical protein [Hyella patelloides LEGE 07179]|uniref:Uncharacterized protein n=1 Tax=Hyella patelloides LEGE 07179 TaxID=945734 RepID=A0A563W1N8_9CYAN|nr:DUF6761 family protein [Hyella patelloides]VEP17608.1 conserved hypothetical protein [Hyella patelloides LEGE 07179]
MLQNNKSIRHYQKLTDSMVDLYHRGYRFEEIRMYMDGYLSCLRQTDLIEAYHIHNLEEEAFRFLRDPSNFEMTQTQIETDYY